MVFNNIMSFDFGTKSIGVAIGQCVTYTASPLTAINACNGVPDWLHMAKLLNEWQPRICIIGLPLNINGTEQPLTFLVREFARNLHNRFSIAVSLHDERLSTVEAKANIFAQGGYRALVKKNIDAKSAVIIMESWFEQCLASP